MKQKALWLAAPLLVLGLTYGAVTPAVAQSVDRAWGRLSASAAVQWGSDLFLRRDAANVLAQRNGTNAQAFRIYNTYTDASNYQRADLKWTSNVFVIDVTGAGTGSASQLRFATGGTQHWALSTSGHFLAITDNTNDIGASGATRPRNIYPGTALVLPTGSSGSPAIAFADETTLGLYRTAGSILFKNASTTMAAFVTSGIDLTGNGNGNAGVLLPSFGKVTWVSNTGVLIRSGTGTPEGTITAPPGSLYLRNDGGAVTSFYVKESGTGNTGWVAK